MWLVPMLYKISKLANSWAVLCVGIWYISKVELLVSLNKFKYIQCS